jgi:hypothetical protein
MLENILGLPTETIVRFPVGGEGDITPDQAIEIMENEEENLQAYQADFREVGANYFRNNPAIRELLVDRIEMEGLGIPERVRALNPLDPRDDRRRFETPFGRPERTFDLNFNFLQRFPFLRYSAEALRLNQVNTYDRDFINGLRDEIIRGEARVGDFVLPSVGRNDMLNYFDAIVSRIRQLRAPGLGVQDPGDPPPPIRFARPTLLPQQIQELIDLTNRGREILGEEEYSMDVIFRRGSMRTPVLGIVALVEYFIFTKNKLLCRW